VPGEWMQQHGLLDAVVDTRLELQLLAGAVKETPIVAFLQGQQGGADRGLGQMQLLGGGGGVLVTSHRQENLEMAQGVLHRALPEADQPILVVDHTRKTTFTFVFPWRTLASTLSRTP